MSTTTPNPLLIACLESFLSPALIIPDADSPHSPALDLLSPPTLSKLRNLGHARARDSRALGHTTQVISHIPVATTPHRYVKLNDALDAGTRMQRNRMVALALLPSGQGEGMEAARELQRCVTKLKFVGGVFATGRGLEEGGFEEVWAMAQRLGVPVVLRDGWPSRDQVCCRGVVERRCGCGESSVDECRLQSTLKTYPTSWSLRWSRTCTMRMLLLPCRYCAFI